MTSSWSIRHFRVWWTSTQGALLSGQWQHSSYCQRDYLPVLMPIMHSLFFFFFFFGGGGGGVLCFVWATIVLCGFMISFQSCNYRVHIPHVPVRESYWNRAIRNTETEGPSWWLPWSSLGTPKLVSKARNDQEDSHPDDISVSVEPHSTTKCELNLFCLPPLFLRNQHD